MDYYGNNDWRDYLAHHGILGQKWGTRNGPPYPLDGSDHSVSEKKAGWRKSLGGGEPSSVRKKRRYITKETKRASKRYDKEIRKSDKEVTRAGKKYEKAAAKGSGSADKKRELYEDAKRDNEFTKRLKDKELERISEMTSKDIAEEKKLVKKNQAERRRNVQKEGFIGGAIDNKISGKKKDEVKSKNRVSDSERNQIKEDVAKKQVSVSNGVKEYFDSVDKGKAVAKTALSNPSKTLSKEDAWALEDYVDSLFYQNTTGGPGEEWTSSKAKQEYYRLRKIVNKNLGY